MNKINKPKINVRGRLKWIIILTLILLLIFFCVTIKAYEKDDLNKGVMHTDLLETVDEGYNYYINKVIYNSDETNSYYCIGFVRKDDIEVNDIYYPYIVYYENDELKWFNINENYLYGEYLVGIYKNEKLIVSGKYSKENTMMLIEYDLKGNISRSKSFNDINISGEVNIKDIYYDQNGLFLIGETNSEEMYLKTFSNTSIFLLKLDNRFDYVDISFLGNKGNNVYLSSLYVNDIIYVLLKLDGEGYHTYETLRPYMIVSYNSRLELVDCTNLDYGINEQARLVYDEESICLISKNDGRNSLVRYKYKCDLVKSNEEEIFTFDDVRVTQFDISYDSTTKNWFIGYNYAYNGGYNAYVILNKDNSILAMTSEKNLINESIKGFSIYNNMIYIHGLDLMKSNKRMLFKRKVFLKVIDDCCYFNGTEGINLTKNSQEVFGNYIGELCFQYGNLLLKVNGSYYIEPIISIKNNSVYDLGTVLYFNGEGKLNGKVINSGYVMNEIGNYILEINGQNAKEFVYFEIEDMGINEVKSPYHNLYYEPITNPTSGNSLSDNGLLEDQPLSNTPYVVKENNYLYLYIGFGVLGLVFAFIPWRKKYA